MLSEIINNKCNHRPRPGIKINCISSFSTQSMINISIYLTISCIIHLKFLKLLIKYLEIVRDRQETDREREMTEID